MATTVKDILIESLNRSNLCPRKRAVPSDLLESAYRLFKGIVSKYNFANYISFARTSMAIVPTDPIIEVEVPGANSITSIQWKISDNDYADLRFVAFEQFYSDNDMYTYTWKYTENNSIEIYLKPLFVSGGKQIVVYFNQSLNYSVDDELRIPEIYIELFTAALTHKLAMTYPRTDSSQVQLLKAELDEIEKQVKSMISSNKILTRDPAAISNRAAFLSGSFIF